MIGSVTELQAEMAAAEKARTKHGQRKRGQLVGHDLAADEPAAEAPAEPEAQKFRQGPARPMQPEQPRPGEFGRGYIETGHAADSPQHDPPTANPQPSLRPGVPVPVQLGNLPVSMPISQHVASSLSLGSPSDR